MLLFGSVRKWGGTVVLHTTSARYSSATFALNEGVGGNPVSHLLDHKNFSTIGNYVSKADDTKVLEALDILRLN